jgi:hypothetical protein
VAEADLRLSLSRTAPAFRHGRDTGKGLIINRERHLLRWLLQNPGSVSTEELAEWVEEFEDPDLKNLVHLIGIHYSNHGDLDVSILLDQVEDERLKHELCALLVGEKGFEPSLADEAFDDWRRTFRRQPLRRAREALREKMTRDSDDIFLQEQMMKINQELAALK